MKTIFIKEISDQGRKALKQHNDEVKKLSFKQRLMMRTLGIKQELISKDPIIISLQIKNRHSNDQRYVGMMVDEIKTALTKNGATKDKDFVIEEDGGVKW